MESNANTNEIEVFIAGKSLKLKGSESPEYFQRLAGYINEKLSKIDGSQGFKYGNNDTKRMMMYLNLADDFFKSKEKIAQMEEELEQKNKEIYELKHDIVSLEMKLEELEK